MTSGWVNRFCSFSTWKLSSFDIFSGKVFSLLVDSFLSYTEIHCHARTAQLVFVLSLSVLDEDVMQVVTRWRKEMKSLIGMNLFWLQNLKSGTNRKLFAAASKLRTLRGCVHWFGAVYQRSEKKALRRARVNFPRWEVQEQKHLRTTRVSAKRETKKKKKLEEGKSEEFQEHCCSLLQTFWRVNQLRCTVCKFVLEWPSACWENVLFFWVRSVRHWNWMRKFWCGIPCSGFWLIIWVGKHSKQRRKFVVLQPLFVLSLPMRLSSFVYVCMQRPTLCCAWCSTKYESSCRVYDEKKPHDEASLNVTW